MGKELRTISETTFAPTFSSNVQGGLEVKEQDDYLAKLRMTKRREIVFDEDALRHHIDACQTRLALIVAVKKETTL